MGRSGSSSRRKRSKKKSTKVSSEGYRKKKSRRNKSKKLRRQDDSFSSSLNVESTSSSLNSFSSSEGEYKRKRARSHSRNDIKGSKKRRRRSLSEDNSRDSSPVKKRKRSKKSKKIKKKKSRRDAFVSSASSGSGSCSTCKDEDRSIDELGSQGRSRGRSREKKDHRDSTKDRIGNRKKRSKSRSSLSPSSSYGGESIEKVMMENNPMRLKSVITVANLEHEEENDMKNNEVKEEMVYDYDDYPSSKSNDSIEAVDHFNMSSDKKGVVKEVNSGSNLDDNKEKESNVSGNVGSEADNLESILRQKALENLSRFRGGIKTKPEVPVDDKSKSDQSGVKQLKHETVSMIPAPQPVISRSRFTWRRDPSVTTAKDEKAATYSEQHTSGSQPAEPKLQSANLSSTSRTDSKFVNETSKIISNTNSVEQKSTAAVIETPSPSSIKEGSSKEQQNEGNDNSQFEKKTMSVMRGGEMVQVSYKVYIPNRAPAMARRQLKR